MPQLTLGEILRDARKARGLGQEQLGAKAKMSKGAIGNIETGRTESPHPSTLTALARALGFSAWDEVVSSVLLSHPDRKPNGHGGMIPVLSHIPASFGFDGDVSEAYDFEEAADYLPGTFRVECSDPRMFGLVIDGDSMSPKYDPGTYIVCSPKHWHDHGFCDGYDYAIRRGDTDTTVKRVHHVPGDPDLIDLVPENRAHGVERISSHVPLAALVVAGGLRRNKLPEVGR